MDLADENLFILTQRFSIGQLTRAAKVNIETIRFYKRRNLIEQPLKPSQCYRCYSRTALARIIFIKRAKALCFTLEKIKSHLLLDESDGSEAMRVAEGKLTRVRAKKSDLRNLEQVLVGMVTPCRENASDQVFPIVNTLQPPSYPE